LIDDFVGQIFDAFLDGFYLIGQRKYGKSRITNKAGSESGVEKYASGFTYPIYEWTEIGHQ